MCCPIRQGKKQWAIKNAICMHHFLLAAPFLKEEQQHNCIYLQQPIKHTGNCSLTVGEPIFQNIARTTNAVQCHTYLSWIQVPNFQNCNQCTIVWSNFKQNSVILYLCLSKNTCCVLCLAQSFCGICVNCTCSKLCSLRNLCKSTAQK